MNILEKLTSIHEELYQNSQEKTDILIEGSAEKLQHLLIKERKYIQLLEQFEVKRQKEVEKWFASKQFNTEEKTITKMMQITSNELEKKKLENSMIRLTNIITKLKQQEQLNNDLMRQSMQFVQMSLEILNPTIDHMNYGNKEIKQTANRSVFDSQA